MIGMAEFPDNYFDLAIVDPPYGIGMAKRNSSIGQKKGQGKITKYKSKDWDNKIPDKEYFDELRRVSQNQIIFGGNYFAKYLPSSMGWIVWDKKQPEGISFAQAELIYTSFQKGIKIYRYHHAGNKVSNNPRKAEKYKKIHHTQKPLDLYRRILRDYANPDMKIIDTHVGSGSSILTFLELGCRWIAFEIDIDHYRDASKRIEIHKAQLNLF